MSHADTIRFGLPPLGSHTVLIREQGPLEEAHAALDALVAENQRLRDALDKTRDVLDEALHILRVSGMHGVSDRLLAALDATPSEDAWHCPDCDWKGAEPEELDVFDSDGMERIAYLCPNCGGTDLNRTPSAAQTLEDAK